MISEGAVMQLKQSDIFKNLSTGILNQIMNTGDRIGFSQGRFVYHKGDRADFLYTLIEGEVRLRIGDEGTEVFTIGGLGEIFGWSSLIGKERHTLSAVCVKQTTVLKMDKRQLLSLIEADPDCSVTFYKQLAKALGNRLLQVYDTVAECKGESTAPSTPSK